MKLRSVVLIMGLVFSWSCSDSSSTSTSPSATVSSVAVSGSASLTSIGQTLQLTATATFSDSTTQNVTSSATWQSSSPSVATVTSGGLVAALATGTVTITATYQGKAGTASISVSLSSSSRSTMSAIIDGTPFNAISVSVVRASIPGLAAGALGIGGTNAFTTPYLVLDLTVPAAPGTYALGPLTVGNASLHQNSTTASIIWDTLNSGGSGTITLTTVTATSAVGTFSLNLVPGPSVGGTATGTKVITSGVFDVTF